MCDPSSLTRGWTSNPGTGRQKSYPLKPPQGKSTCMGITAFDFLASAHWVSRLESNKYSNLLLTSNFDLTFQIQTLVLSGIPCKHCFSSISQILAYLFLLCLDIFDEQITCAYRKRLREKAVLYKAPCDTQHAHPIIFCICLIFSFFFFQLEDNLLYRLLYRFLL